MTDGANRNEPAGGPTASERRRAVFRIVLGQVQMIGAVVSVCLLAATGLSNLFVVASSVTCLALVASRLLFSKKDHSQGGR